MAKILTATIHVRVTPEEKENFQDAANDAAQSLGEWVRKSLINSLQTTKPSAAGEGVLRMERGKHVAVIPALPAVPESLPEIIDAIVPERYSQPPWTEGMIQRKVVPPFQVTQVPVTAPPAPPAPAPEPVAVVTPRPMSMVDRMYAIIEARDGKEKADFWLATSAGKRK